MEDGMTSTALRFYLQSEARRILPEHRVGQCLRAVVPNHKLVEVWKDTNRGKAHYRHLRTCGSIWVCPICASKISEHRKREIRRVINALVDQPVLCLFTLSHAKKTPLRVTVAELLAAYAGFTSGKGWQDIRTRFDIFGWVRSLEFTHGDNGWHPHLHVIMWAKAKNYDCMRDAMGTRWGKILNTIGKKYVTGISFNLKEADKDVGDYVAKMGVQNVNWDIEHEVAKSVIKKAKPGHRNPIQLLYDSAHGDRVATKLFKEYAEFTAGKRQLEWSRSPNLKMIAGVLDIDDSDIMDIHEESAYLMASLTIEQWHKVLRVGGVGDLLDMAEHSNIMEFYTWLKDICDYVPIHEL